MRRDQNLGMALTEQEKTLLRQAAKTERRSLSDFVRIASTDHAKKILEGRS